MVGLLGAVRGRVLVVESEDLLRWSVEQHLAKRGFLVTAARDGAEALPLLAGAAYDVVIADRALSGDDGLAVAAEARRLHAETQVVIVSEQSSKGAILQALRQGVSDYLEKPLDFGLLVLSVEKALEKSLVLRELIQLARTDGLTGLFNQRHFYSALELEIKRSRRQSRALSLLLVDVDDFKRYNDRFGHLAGDAALARIAASLKRACRRDTDSAYRYGGDEFILMLPETDCATAAAVASRVRTLLVEEGISLTLSIGVAELRPNQDLKAFIREADRAMYRDKSSRRTDALPRVG